MKQEFILLDLCIDKEIQTVYRQLAGPEKINVALTTDASSSNILLYMFVGPRNKNYASRENSSIQTLTRQAPPKKPYVLC